LLEAPGEGVDVHARGGEAGDGRLGVTAVRGQEIARPEQALQARAPSLASRL